MNNYCGDKCYSSWNVLFFPSSSLDAKLAVSKLLLKRKESNKMAGANYAQTVMYQADSSVVRLNATNLFFPESTFIKMLWQDEFSGSGDKAGRACSARHVHGWLSEKQSRPAVRRPEGNTCPSCRWGNQSPSGSSLATERIWERGRYFKAACSLKLKRTENTSGKTTQHVA